MDATDSGKPQFVVRAPQVPPCPRCGKPWSESDFAQGWGKQCKECAKKERSRGPRKSIEQIRESQLKRYERARVAKRKDRACVRCGKPWVEEEFHGTTCKKCRSELKTQKARERYEQHKEEFKLSASKRYRAKRERILAGRHLVCKKAKVCSKCGKPWSADAFSKGKSCCKACDGQQYKSWCKNNPDKARAKRHRRRSRKAGAGGSHTGAEAVALYVQQRGKCAECGVKMTIKSGPRQRNLDHVQPIALGGSSSIENLRWTCRKCNFTKGSMDPYEWANMHGKLFV